MKLRNIVVMLLALVMVFVLCACGEVEDVPTTTAAPTVTAPTEGTTEPTDDGKVTYTVKVVDEGGNAVAGAIIQLCDDNGCKPGTMTGADGLTTWRLNEGTYKASFVVMPTGYTSEQTEYYFADGAYELTITLKAVA